MRLLKILMTRNRTQKDDPESENLFMDNSKFSRGRPCHVDWKLGDYDIWNKLDWDAVLSHMGCGYAAVTIHQTCLLAPVWLPGLPEQRSKRKRILIAYSQGALR